MKRKKKKENDFKINQFTKGNYTQRDDFERRLCTQTLELYIIKTFHMSQMNPKNFLHNTSLSVQLPPFIY